jgi:menaquinone-dependent protoporphyrinogen IX oxidase
MDFDRNADLVIIGAPVYAGHFPKALMCWARENRDWLHTKKLAFYSVSLNAADLRPEARHSDDLLLRQMINEIGVVPQYLASFAGALRYRSYGFIKRFIMKRISRAAQGPVDTSRDYEMTEWDRVNSFISALFKQDQRSAFSTTERFPLLRNMDEFAPLFEQIWSTEMYVQRPQTEVFEALRTLPAKDMKLANLLGQIRTLGRAGTLPPNEPFMISAERFGNTPLCFDPPREIAAGLIGKFWRLDFGLRRIAPDDFLMFNEAGYTKVVSNFLVTAIPDTSDSRVYAEMRIHSTTPQAARKFKIYWTLLRPGIHLYMRSALRALRRRALIQGQLESYATRPHRTIS